MKYIKVESWFADEKNLPAVKFPIEVVHETEDAVLAELVDSHDKKRVWIPKSLITSEGIDKSIQTLGGI